MKHTIKDLRQKGYKVRVLHTRITKPKFNLSGVHNEVVAKGGSTVIELTTPDKLITVVGEAICSLEDNFNRRVGNQIALGRAWQQLEFENKG